MYLECLQMFTDDISVCGNLFYQVELRFIVGIFIADFVFFCSERMLIHDSYQIILKSIDSVLEREPLNKIKLHGSVWFRVTQEKVH